MSALFTMRSLCNADSCHRVALIRGNQYAICAADFSHIATRVPVDMITGIHQNKK